MRLLPLYITLAILLGIAVVIISWWAIVSYRTFPRRFKPGDKYRVGSHESTIPNLPHKTYRTNQIASKSNAIPGLDEETLNNMHTLLDKTMNGLREMNVDFYVTGGTLLGAQVWENLIVYDDDLDLTVFWKDRETIWSQEFVDNMDKHGLEVFYLRGSSLDFATKEGAAVRLRLKNSVVPTCDVFTTYEHANGKLTKVDSWNGDKIVHSSKEIWQKDWVYPIQQKELGGMMWNLPNQPEKLLQQQYGSDWNKTTMSPHFMLSHKWVFQMTNMVGAWRAGQPTLNKTIVNA
jgi:hypothetical protein